MQAGFCNSKWRDCLYWESTSKVQWKNKVQNIHTDDQIHVNKLTVDAWRWPKSLFAGLASHGWGGWHRWMRTQDKALHSLGHAWATRLAPDLHTVHTHPNIWANREPHTASSTHPAHAHGRSEERTGSHHGEIYTVYNWWRLQEEEKSHNKYTQGCMRVKRLPRGTTPGKRTGIIHLKRCNSRTQTKKSGFYLHNSPIIVPPPPFKTTQCPPFCLYSSLISNTELCNASIPTWLQKRLFGFLPDWVQHNGRLEKQQA